MCRNARADDPDLETHAIGCECPWHRRLDELASFSFPASEMLLLAIQEGRTEDAEKLLAELEALNAECASIRNR